MPAPVGLCNMESAVKWDFNWEGHTAHLKLNALYSLDNKSFQMES